MNARRQRGALALALAAVIGLAGCANPVPEPQPEPVPAQAPPVLDATQSARILDQVEEVLATGDAAFDANQLDPRVTGPALAIRSAEYVRAQATGGERPPVTIPAEAQVTITPDTTSWPRTQIVVTEQPADLQAPLLLVLIQNSPREEYKLWGWARLGEGVQMPATAAPATGSPQLSADDTSLVLPPEDVLAQYADVLTNGDASPYAATFGTSFFRSAIEAVRAQTVQGLQAVATVSETVAPEAGSVSALGTVDGGAIVVGQMTTVTTAAISQGTVTLTDPLDKALTGKESVSQNLVRTWTDVVVFYVPPAGSDAGIQVLAAEHARTAVTGE